MKRGSNPKFVCAFSRTSAREAQAHVARKQASDPEQTTSPPTASLDSSHLLRIAESLASASKPQHNHKMSHRQGGGRNKVLLPPINFIFKLLQQHTTVQIWLYEQLGMRIEGKIRGFDEFMNLVIDDAVEVKQSTKHDPNPQDGPNGGRRELGMYNSEKLREYSRKNRN